MKSSNNTSKNCVAGLFATLLGLLSISVAHAQIITLANSPGGGSISSFGASTSPTYGEVFTAPTSGTLTSFTLSLNGGVGSLYGGVGTWNGPASFGLGYGSPVNLYQSGNVSSLSASSYTFSPNVNVVSGHQYVAYLSVFGDSSANSNTSMPLSSTSVSGIDYFVWNNTADQRNNSRWDYSSTFGNADFSASFSSTPAAAPEPSTWAMLLGGLGLLAYLRQRSRPALV